MRVRKTRRLYRTLRRLLAAGATRARPDSSWVIFLSSLLWFLLRTGTRPSRAVYPCQRAAQTNMLVFGPSIVAPIWQRLARRRRLPLRVAGVLLLALSFLIGAQGLTGAKAKVVSWFWRPEPLAEREGRVVAQASGSRVVWVHDSGATSWDYGSSYYGDHVSQSVVDQMVDQGLMALTGASSVAEAWRQIIPDYEPGKAIAIKVNFNCSSGPEDTDIDIDALIHPVNAIVRGLKQIDVREEDVWVYEAVRCIPHRFVDSSLYRGVRFFGAWCQEIARFDSDDPDAQVHFSDHTQQVTDVVVNASYLINMPIVKRHGYGQNFGVTLSFKNHYGTIQTPGNLHENRSLRLVALNSNAHIRDKTRLVVGDALFGHWENNGYSPKPWNNTFANQYGKGSPDSLFFATDPVAADSVMADILEAEAWISDEPDEYMNLAEQQGLGVYERGYPWGSGYSRIDFVKCDAQGTTDPRCYGAGEPTATPTPTSTDTATPTPTYTLTPTGKPLPTPSNTAPKPLTRGVYLPIIVKSWAAVPPTAMVMPATVLRSPRRRPDAGKQQRWPVS
jgi:uncharacterized protein (DUF362 family)